MYIICIYYIGEYCQNVVVKCIKVYNDKSVGEKKDT